MYTDVSDTIEKSQDEGKDCFVTVLEGPMKEKDEIKILQIVTEAKAVNPQ